MKSNLTNIFKQMIFIWGLFFVVIPSFAQISAGGTPPSFHFETENVLLQSTVTLPIDFDVVAMREEDESRRLKRLQPRVGRIIPVNFTTENSGEWSMLPDGQQIWRLSIIAEDAIAIMLTYDKFEIPEGGKLFIYNDDRSRVLGAYTEENNPNRAEYASEFVAGDQITLEYVPSASGITESPIIMTGVVYGYNNLYTEKPPKEGQAKIDFGASDPCMINVTCPEGNGWTDQKKGVVRIVTNTGGSFYSMSSGSMINNTAEDLDRLLLSAHHCFSGLSPAQMNQTIYYFNYEHPTCSGRSDPVVPTLTGATMLVNIPVDGGSDGALVRLNEGSVSWFVTNGIYFNGWDRRNIAATSGVGIHHPKGDVKKISTVTTPAFSAGELQFEDGAISAPNSAWVVQWAATVTGHSVTQGGSSGSPFFDQNKRIVGTLSGGTSNCDNPTGYDVYGKLWYHWDQYASQQMKPYLDPINSGAEYINGTYTQKLASMTVNPTSLNFGFVNKNTTSPAQTVTVAGTNLKGNVTCVKTGTGAAAFYVTPTSLGPNGGTFTVTFEPIAAGSYSATLTISSPGVTSKTVTLSGTALDFCAGNGTSGNPFQICTVVDLAYLASFVNAGNGNFTAGKYFKLMNDLNLNVPPYNTGTGWTPIGNPTNPFKGVFDGNNKKITGFYLNDSNLNYAGLFGYVDGGSVKNLGIENVNINGKDYVGSVAARVENSGNLSNCYSTGATYGFGTVGGVAGMINTGSSLSNCYSTSSISGMSNLGGVAGQVAENSTLSNCYATGIVIGSGNYIGGVAGSVIGGSSLSNSAALNPSVKRDGTTNVGRVAGRNDGSTLTNNAAFDGILNHAGNTTWNNKGANNLDGVDMGKPAINTDGTIGGRFTTPIWTVQNGKLPGLGNAVNMPVHLLIEPTITTTSLPNGITNTPYSATLTATGATPITWSITSGNLPTGLTINAATGVISGTPTVANTFNFTVKAENIAGNDTKELSITITAPPVITTTTLPSGVTGTAYSATLTATGTTPITWSIISGNLPTGLTINAATGVISGTPTVANTFNFTVKAENSAGNDTKPLSITITTAPVPPAIITTTLPIGITGTPYNVTLAVTGTAPITWSITSGNLPTGLTLNATTGEISGTPTTAEIFEFTVKAENGAGDDAKELSITIEDEVGIEQLKMENGELKIYPNPTTGELRIIAGANNYSPEQIMGVQVFDVMGRAVGAHLYGRPPLGVASTLRLDIASLGVASTLRLDISHLPNGIYFLRITTEKGTVTKKVVKQ